MVIKTAHSLGVTDYDESNYARLPNGEAFLRGFTNHLDLLGPEAKPRPGAVGLFRTTRYPMHCAIFSLKHGRLHLIHGHAFCRKVVEEPYAHEWPGSLTHLLEFPGAEPWRD